MTRQEEDAQDLRVINNSMEALREIARLPEQSEFSLIRAHAHTHAINTSCRALMARAECAEVLARVAA